MRIHKFTHSCIYIEDDTSILFDPGSYTAKEKTLDLENIRKIDYLLITHEHADHFDIPLIKKIINKFPEVKIITNPSVQALLKKESITSDTRAEQMLSFGQAKHEKVFGPDVENWTMTVGDKVFNPGDSYQFSTTKELLLLPIQAPWGHMVQAIAKARQVRPRYVIPVHDWHWREEARKALYEQAKSVLSKDDITFIADIENNPFDLK